jgi:hypothetical protein
VLLTFLLLVVVPLLLLLLLPSARWQGPCHGKAQQQ